MALLESILPWLFTSSHHSRGRGGYDKQGMVPSSWDTPLDESIWWLQFSDIWVLMGGSGSENLCCWGPDKGTCRARTRTQTRFPSKMWGRDFAM